MKTKKYKTIEGLLSQSKYGCIDLYDFFERAICLNNGRGYVHFTLPRNEDKLLAKHFAYVLGGQKRTREKIKRIILERRINETFSVYTRVVFGKEGVFYQSVYDYISERKKIRKLLLKSTNK